nr:branched-chain amino acid ABC transporter substrate-binding protein [Labedaea rhizosphaerae]
MVAAASFALSACAANSDNGSGNGGNNGSTKVDIPVVTNLPVSPNAAKPAGDGKGKCSGVSLAYAGAKSGANAQLGINILNGVKLAIQEHNQANKDCQVKLKEFDTEGDPGKAPGVVTQLLSESDIIGMVGLPFSGESKATGGAIDKANLVHITPSATNPDLTKNGWTTFYRALGNDSVQGPAAAKFITGKLQAKVICVIQDDSDYGIGLANAANQALGAAAQGCQDKVTTGQKDFSATTAKVINAKADAVFYAGYYAEGAPLDQQLVTKGFKGTFIGPDGVKDDQFIKQAGSASANAFFTCPCVPGELIPDFAKAYEGVSGGTAPGTYSLEGYDAATILLKGIDSGIKDRAALRDFVKSYDGDGFSKHFKWNPDGELAQSTVYGYKVQDGKIQYVGTIS